MSVLAPERNIDERLSAMANRLGRANDQIESLEDKLVAARYRVREADRQRTKTERQLARAKERVTVNHGLAKASSDGAVVIDGACRLGVNKTEAASMLGVSVDFFDVHVAPELRCVRRGRRRIYAVAELRRWLDAEGESVRPAGYAS